MNQYDGPLINMPDYLVCTCFGVMHSEIVAAIERGANTLGKLSDELMVGTGCSSCIEEVVSILEKMREQ